MAYSDLIAALRLPAHPLARSGYGKRSTPAQEPYQQQDFAHLPLREGCIAAYIDRLPEGSAIDTKTLAKQLPLYGQQAVRTALRHLADAGHLRRVKETVGTRTQHWVQRTYFSAVARDNAWWDAYLAGLAAPQPPAPRGSDHAPAPDPEAEPEAAHQPTAVAEAAAEPETLPAAVVEPFNPPSAPVSAAYQALAALGSADARLTLSAAECGALEGLAAEWFARGTTPGQFALALTAGLPQVVHSAGALARNRLVQKMPADISQPPQPQLPRQRRIVMECIDCGRPGASEALPGGICQACRSDGQSQPATRPLASELRLRVAGLRSALRAGPALAT